MEVYLLKSAACMAIFLLFYKFLLEKENMHLFKRFYLLGTMIASLLIPLVVFTEYVPMVVEQVTYPVENVAVLVQETPPARDIDTINFSLVFLSIYLIGVIGFGFRFIRNLFQIFQRVRNNPTYKSGFITHVLLKELMAPHTFFKHIFLNKKNFEAKAIPKEVLLHEETHAKQYHSIDVLFIELLQVALWFNPFIYLFTKSIKLNHEFLADRAVLKKDVNTVTYQNTLLSYLSPDSEKKYQPALANAINYSSIKKRFTIMKTHTSKKSIAFRSILLLPLMALLLTGFSETKIEFENEAPAEVSINNDKSFEPRDVSMIADGTSKRSIEIAGLVLDSETLLPIENVEIYDASGKVISKTDSQGYYKVQFDELGKGAIKFSLHMEKNGYKPLSQKEHWGDFHGKMASTFYFGLQKNQSKSPEFSELYTNIQNLSYESIHTNFDLVKTRLAFDKKLRNAKMDNQHVLIEIDNVFYLVNDSGWIKLNSKEDLISINDTEFSSAKNVNNILQRKEITGMTPLTNHKALFAIYTGPEGIPNKITREYDSKNTYEIEIKLTKEGQIFIHDEQIALEDLAAFLAKKKPTVVGDEKPQMVRSVVYAEQGSSQKTIEKIDEILRKYGSDTINIVGVDTPSAAAGVTAKELREYKKLLEKYSKTKYGETRVLLKEVERVQELYLKMTPNQRRGVKRLATFSQTTAETQDGATKSQLSEYNKLAKKYNEMNRNNMSIKMKDVERLEYLYSLLNEKQKANAQPFPDFPPMPEAPEAPEALGNMEIEELGELAEIREVEEIEEVTAYMEEVPKPERAPAPEALEQIEIIEEHIAIPPPPPAPQEPLDHAIEMAKKGAIFYYEGKKISSDKAIELLKKNKSINMDSRNSNGKKPVIRLSKRPIKIGSAEKTSKKNRFPGLLQYATSLAHKKAQFYVDGAMVTTAEGLKLIKLKNYSKVETLPWVSKTPEVRIYSKA